MSIMLPRYSGFPPEIFESGLVPLMSDSALRLYLFLCRTSDRKSRLQFAATDKEIKLQAGASARSLRDARLNLIALGLIACERAPGGAYAYSLCDVATGKPFPGDPTRKAPYVKKCKTAKPENAVPVRLPSTRPLYPPTLVAIGPPPPSTSPLRLKSTTRYVPGKSTEDTSFAYGHNPPLTEKIYFPINAYDDHR